MWEWLGSKWPEKKEGGTERVERRMELRKNGEDGWVGKRILFGSICENLKYFHILTVHRISCCQFRHVLFVFNFNKNIK